MNTRTQRYEQQARAAADLIERVSIIIAMSLHVQHLAEEVQAGNLDAVPQGTTSLLLAFDAWRNGGAA